MTRILVLGASGMLGHRMSHVLSKRFDVFGAFRSYPEHYPFLDKKKIVLANKHTVFSRIGELKPDLIVNCAGAIKQNIINRAEAVKINAYFPHQLEEIYKGRIIHISTDCVFSGLIGNYTEENLANPTDLYGRSKLCGEIYDSLTIRTSIVGWQLKDYKSLLSWFAMQRGKSVTGYTRAIFSGLPTTVLAQIVGEIIEKYPDMKGLYHISSKPISKFDLLTKLRDALGWNIQVLPYTEYMCDRSLNCDKFSNETGFVPPAWDDLVGILASEWPEYEQYYADGVEK